MNTSINPTAASALVTLIVLQLVMLAALFAQVQPHPHAVIVPFGIAPFLGASLSAAACALIYGASSTRLGRVFCISAGAMALISFGPQKFIHPSLPQIWPSVIAGQIAVIALINLCLRPKKLFPNWGTKCK